jgi:hypothetical protein
MASQNGSIFLSECDLQNKKKLSNSNSNYIQFQIIFEKTFFVTCSLNLKIYPRNDDAGDVGRKLDQTGKEK